MSLRNWLGIWTTRCTVRDLRHIGDRPASRSPATSKLGMETLEDRLALSGLGPEDGAYIVEPWLGGYFDVEIQPGDQKIVAAGSTNRNIDHSDTRIAIARYNSLGAADNTFGIGSPSMPPLNGLSAPALSPIRESGIGLMLQPDGKAVVSGSISEQGTYKCFNRRGPLRRQRRS